MKLFDQLTLLLLGFNSQKDGLRERLLRMLLAGLFCGKGHLQWTENFGEVDHLGQTKYVLDALWIVAEVVGFSSS